MFVNTYYKIEKQMSSESSESQPQQPTEQPAQQPQPQPQQVRLPPFLQHLQHLQGDELKEAINKEYFFQAMGFILRQTEYDEETAAKKLYELKDPVKVVSEYLGVKPKPEPELKSKNQMKYGEIRKFMDFGARKYNLQKELQKKQQELQEQLEQKKQQAQQEQEQKNQEQQEQQFGNGA